MADPISSYLQSRSSDKAASAQKEAAQAGQDTQWKMYEQTRADQLPWMTQGKNSLEQLGGMMGQGGALNQRYQQFKPMTMANFQADPSYNFRRNEGIRGIENSMAGRSGFGGGNMLKALARYNSDLASTEYGAANDRYNQNFATGYNQFNQDQNTIFNRLAALSGTGQTTAANLGSMGQNTANAVSGAQSDYGDAAARRYMGRAGVYKDYNDDLMKIAGIAMGQKRGLIMAYNYLQDMPRGGSMDSFLGGYDVGQKYRQNQIIKDDNKALADILRGDTNAITRLQSPELIQKAQAHLRELEQRKALQGFYTPATKDKYQANVTQNPIAAIMDGGKKPSNLVQAQQPSYQESQAPTMLDMLQTGKVASGKPASYDFEGAGNYLLGQVNFDQLGKLTDYQKAIAKDSNDFYGGLTEGVDENGKPILLAMTKKGAVPSGYSPRPKDGKAVPVMENGRPKTVQVPNTNDVKILMSDGTLMSGGSISKPESLEDSTNSFTPAAIDNAAARYNIDGTLPPMGMGKGGSAARSQILNRAAELAIGVNGTDQRVNQLTTKASASTLLQLKKTKTMIKAFEEMANKNADIALEMSAKVDRSGTPVVNRWFLAANNKIAGDVDTATFNTAVNVFANEYAKIMSGSMGNTPVSDSARKEAHEILNTAQTPAQLKANIQLLQREMKNRLIGLDESEAELIQQMKGGKKEDAHGGGNDPYAITKDTDPRRADYLKAHKELVDMKDYEGAKILTEMYKRGAK